jgi:ribonuclease-3
VLGLAITRHLYERFPDRSEGELARMRAHVVSRASCAAVGRELGLDELFLRQAAGPPSDVAALAASDTVIAEVVEAGIGACFLEVGLERVAKAVVEAFAGRVAYALDQHVDHKTVLQEELARQGRSVTYALVETSGPDHDRRFTSVALVEGAELGRGSGGSKKASEQEAAREALEQIARAGK